MSLLDCALITSLDSSSTWLELADRTAIELKLASQSYLPKNQYWQLYLNELCRQTIAPWWQDISYLSSSLEVPQEGDFYNTLLSGIAGKIDETRIVFLPSYSRDFTQLEIPKEWLESASWCCSYFIAVIVDLDSGYLRVGGYSDRDTIFSSATYDATSHNYYLDSHYLQSGIDTLIPTIEFCRVPIPSLEPITLTLSQRTAAIARIATSIVPRLAVDFSTWTAILTDPASRNLLYREITSYNQPTVARISHWLTDKKNATATRITDGWQDLAASVDRDILLPLFGWQPAFATRYQASDAATSIIPNLTTIDDLDALRQEINNLLKISPNSDRFSAAIATLATLVDTATDVEKQWLAAEAIWLMQPEHPQGGIWQTYPLDIATETIVYRFDLVIAALPTNSSSPNNSEVSIFVRLFPQPIESLLPQNLQLKILTPLGDTFTTINAGSNDRVLQYKLQGIPEETFTIVLQLEENSVRLSLTI